MGGHYYKRCLAFFPPVEESIEPADPGHRGRDHACRGGSTLRETHLDAGPLFLECQMKPRVSK